MDVILGPNESESDCLCLALNMIACVNGRVKCEFRSFSFGFRVLLFRNDFRYGLFLIYRSDLFVQTGDCTRNFVASGSDDFK
jgi:hypothetical protein